MTADTHHSVTRRFGRAMGLVAVLALGALALSLVVPLAFGARPFTVLTSSMEPAISAGDVVVEERISPLDAGIGDVVTFKDHADQDRLITHRVQAVRRDGPFLWFVTRGDANNASERWRISAGGDLGRVLYRVPLVGHVAAFAGTWAGLLLLLLVPLSLLAVDELRRIWRPRGEEGIGEAV